MPNLCHLVIHDPPVTARVSKLDSAMVCFLSLFAVLNLEKKCLLEKVKQYGVIDEFCMRRSE
jgi:hypothetical protein